MKDFVTPHAIGRFFRHVTIPHQGEHKCWEWIGSKCEKGYGLFRAAPRRIMRAHRFALLAFGGGVESDQLACHRCDNPGCVNPHHLFAGTALDNAHDRDRKGRQVAPRGPAHWAFRITPEAAKEIVRRGALGEKQRDIAADYDVSQHTVWRVLRDARQ